MLFITKAIEPWRSGLRSFSCVGPDGRQEKPPNLLRKGSLLAVDRQESHYASRNT